MSKGGVCTMLIIDVCAHVIMATAVYVISSEVGSIH